ncbi:MAG: hypothetical protein IPG50_35890 [Myxococcales bacterium]|nr:hypothetical protein [Myxococcales bacterium]
MLRRVTLAGLFGVALVFGSPACSSDASPAGDTGPANAAPTSSASKDGGTTATNDGGAGDGDAKATPTDSDGVLIGGPGPLPGAIAGIAYKSGKFEGTTDAKGTFHYEVGGTITFSIAGVALATVPAKAKLSPFALAGGACTANDALRRVLVTLETLDADGKPETGIALPPIAAKAGETRTLAAMPSGDYDTWLGALSQGKAKADETAALTRFIEQVDGEAWATPDPLAFDTATSATRSQGVVFDGSGYVFSWTLGLQRTDTNLAVTVNKTAAIPIDMLIGGSSHIGDVDLHQGTLYAPIEDKKYEKPTIVLFDPMTLNEKGQRFAIPTSILSQGVPWIAVDGKKQVAYLSQWDPIPAIEVFDLATFAHKTSIPLSKPMGRIQGAKVSGSSLYTASDDAEKSVHKIDLDTGIVLPKLFDYGGAAVVKELEGLTFMPAAAGTPAKLRVLGVAGTGSSVTFFTHARTRAPLRDDVCGP